MNYHFNCYGSLRPGIHPTHPIYTSCPLHLSESFITYENLRRDNIGGLSTQEESLTSRLGAESQSSQNEVDSKETNNQSKYKIGKLKWTQVKDVDLCRSWIAISKDSVKGNDHNIGKYYNNWRREDLEIPIEKAAKHWFKMSGDVNKFNGCYIQIKDSHPCGHNEEEITNKAMGLFSNVKENRKFPYLHVWQILRNDPKWQEFARKQGSPSMKSKVVRSCASISSFTHHDKNNH
ncbi:uncharacterized protein LOC110692206 [Chenopodium quinoa]|uniref:uncharacterized protein LOC110692206 n=1 Tax=Chenopodium quinoa TaxID=63459 RepID=UPI000B774241|nr:uncharacterized protein LOC110692206 [Chenopodium quinoa]